MCIFGEVLRKTAMVTASSGFTHTVQNKRKENHKLVTSGVYSWARHPSYVGWFYWAIATQVEQCIHPLFTVRDQILQAIIYSNYYIELNIYCRIN